MHGGLFFLWSTSVWQDTGYLGRNFLIKAFAHSRISEHGRLIICVSDALAELQ